jgi:hypothetical protein
VPAPQTLSTKPVAITSLLRLFHDPTCIKILKYKPPCAHYNRLPQNFRATVLHTMADTQDNRPGEEEDEEDEIDDAVRAGLRIPWPLKV